MPSAMTARLVFFGKVVEHEHSDVVERPQCWTILHRDWTRETIGPSLAGYARQDNTSAGVWGPLVPRGASSHDIGRG
jgi:hypothetical protein